MSGCQRAQQTGPAAPPLPATPTNVVPAGAAAPHGDVPSAYARVQDAAARGRISRKEAVLLIARLRYAPATIPADSAFAPAPGAAVGADVCGTGFYKDVHQVCHEFSDDERRWLASLSEDLRVILAQHEHSRSSQ